MAILPLVSVVMAAFNVGSRDVLDSSILSIINQDTSDWELVICDDGSTDGTYEWLLDWARRDNRIHVLRNGTNRKSAYARNRCLAQAKGRYIAIMDADDMCSANRLRVQVEFLSSYPEFSFVGLKGERFVQIPGDTNQPCWFCRTPQPKDFRMTLPFIHGSLLFRREALDAVDGYEESARVERSEDYDMLLRMYAKGLRGANLSSATYYFREDNHAFRRRKYRYRFPEVLVKLKGFSRLGLMPQGIFYAFKPLVVGLIPTRPLNWLKSHYYNHDWSSYE